jgi:hypothetical protein
VGCPIRRSRDQRALASTPGFSQRATSFIASRCQGIHQMPLGACSSSRRAMPLSGHIPRRSLRKDTLRTGSRSQKPEPGSQKTKVPGSKPQASFRRPVSVSHVLHNEKQHSGIRDQKPETRSQASELPEDRGQASDPDASPLSSALRPPLSGLRSPASALRPPPPRVPAFNWCPPSTGGGERIRTADPLLAKQVLSQLSYTPVRGQKPEARTQNPET